MFRRNVNQIVFPQPVGDHLSEDEVLALKNRVKRVEYIENQWPSWPIWVDIPELQMTVRRIILPDGYSICATYMKGTETNCSFGEDKGKVQNAPRLCMLKPDQAYKPEDLSPSWIAEHLKDLRKKLVEEHKQQ